MLMLDCVEKMNKEKLNELINTLKDILEEDCRWCSKEYLEKVIENTISILIDIKNN